MFQQKRMFKVLSPVEKEGGNTWWMRCGTGFVNKDNSINVYLDAMPLRMKPGEGVKLQLRELTDEELREREEKRSTYSARGTLDFKSSPAAFNPASSAAGAGAADGVPF